MNETDASPTPAESTPPRPKLGRTFWTLNVIEMWERLAYTNLRALAPIYIMQADDAGGLHLTAGHKGMIYAWWAVFQSLLPTFTGGLADRFGYKRTLAFAVSTMMTGYLMLAFLRDIMPAENDTWNYLFFFLGILTLATGTAFFKPGLQGSLAHQMTKENASLGWGIFYWVVNLGAFAGYYVPTLVLAYSATKTGVHTKEAWRNLFLTSAVFTSFNFVLLLTFRDVASGASKTESVLRVMRRTVTNVVEPRLLTWILLMACFWMMMYQLWDLHPNFITDWVDSGPIARGLESWLPAKFCAKVVVETPRGPMIPQQVLLSLNSGMVILGVVGASWLTRRMRTLSAMLIGMVAVMCGLYISGATQNVWFLLGGIIFFPVGEMVMGPKMSQYLALIAPPGKKGLYLGYASIPAGVGIFVGSWMAGILYGRWGEKAVLALRYLAEKTPSGIAKHWNGQMGTLETTLGVSRSHAMQKLQEATGMNPAAATQMLWNTYSPQLVWLPFLAIGVVAAVGLWIFGQRAKRWKDMNA
jgi:proton-dependent oligopeptide transporter, POT family